MASRYSYTKKLTTKETKKQYLETTIYPKIKPTDNDMYIIATSSDRLDLLAKQYLNDVSLWWVIAWFNKKPTENDFEIGQQVLVPYPLERIFKYFGE